MPERITEYPSVYELPEELVTRIDNWEKQQWSESGFYCSYERDLSVCPGTKIGGYLHVIQSWWVPTCSCGQVMDHLLTVETVEWNGTIDLRWTPREEQDLFASLSIRPENWDAPHNALAHALWIPTGLQLGDAGHVQLFVCRHCGKWPVVPSIECC